MIYILGFIIDCLLIKLNELSKKIEIYKNTKK